MVAMFRLMVVLANDDDDGSTREQVMGKRWANMISESTLQRHCDFRY